MEIFLSADNSLYARGVANDTPVKINGGTNKISVEAYDANNAEPPAIRVKPV
jgi:hypothetical protein